MANQVTLTFAGDAKDLDRASKQAESAVDQVGKAVVSQADEFDKASKSSEGLGDRLGNLGSTVTGAGDAFDGATGLLQGYIDVQNSGYERAQRLARATVDVQQATEDLNQAQRDGKQSTIDLAQAQVDLEQAQLDSKTAHDAYIDAVKENGANSTEAKQALIDYKQTTVDVQQAQEDAAQAQRDGAQAAIDAKSAQLDLNDAQREANPPDIQKWSDQLQSVGPILQGVTAVVALVTAAQWAWNAAQLASPTTWIVLAILALIGVIVLIATKTDWFQRAWRASWNWIKKAALNVWDWLKDLPKRTGEVFGKIAHFITAPYRAAFNFIADAWNNTVGGLHFTVPDWIPGIGGNSVTMPKLRHFHTGVSRVPGGPGSEMLAVLQGGEEVRSRSGVADDASGGWVAIRGDAVIDALVEAIAARVDRRGGRAAQLGIRFAS